MAVHFDTEALLTAVDFRLAIHVNADATVSKKIVTKTESITERGDHGRDHVFIAQRIRIVLQMKVPMETDFGRGAADLVREVTGVGFCVSTISIGRAAAVSSSQ